MNVQIISCQQTAAAVAASKVDFIDVRTPAEYAQIHAQGTRNIPLDQLDPQTLASSRQASPDTPLYLICKGGGRSANACQKLLAAGLTNVLSVDGGTTAWEAAGLPVVRGGGKVISLERQVRIAAGLIVLLGVLLGYLLHPAAFALSGFVGAGLVFAGISDTCAMGMLLAKMPWNRCANGAACASC
jgi:rhodanese-related sulfurtransferase